MRYLNRGSGVGPEMRVGTLSRVPIAAAQMGRADAVRFMLPAQLRAGDASRNSAPGVLRNRMALREGPGATECERLGRVAEALHTALLHSAPPSPGEPPIIRILPAWPREWDADFSLLARGNFLVSASVEKGTLHAVEIESRAGGALSSAESMARQDAGDVPQRRRSRRSRGRAAGDPDGQGRDPAAGSRGFAGAASAKERFVRPWIIASILVLAGASFASAASIDVKQLDRERVIAAADKYLNEQPRTVTADKSPRSAGGLHDFHSEGDYWWPDPKNPDGPYIQKDGQTNPDNFVAHRHSMVRMSMPRRDAHGSAPHHQRREIRRSMRSSTSAPGSSMSRRG